MNRNEQIERLIHELVESIDDALRGSGKIRELLGQIEDQGYEIRISVLAGIVLKEASSLLDTLSGLFGDDTFDDDEEAESSSGGWDPENGDIFTAADLRFLHSLGITPE